MPDTAAKPEGSPSLPEGQAQPRNQADPRSARAWLPTVKVTIAAFVLALLVGAMLIVFSDRRAREALGYFFGYPWDFFKFAGQAVGDSYWALLTGPSAPAGRSARRWSVPHR